jgi:hypothetical protein
MIRCEVSLSRPESIGLRQIVPANDLRPPAFNKQLEISLSSVYCTTQKVNHISTSAGPAIRGREKLTGWPHKPSRANLLIQGTLQVKTCHPGIERFPRRLL